jgi:hypothetical protein
MILNVSKLSVGEILAEKAPTLFSLSEGMDVDAAQNGVRGYALERVANGFGVAYGDISDLMTALGDIVSETDSERFLHPLEFRGMMLDASRNGVPKPEWIEKFILELALLGYNRFCLYTEDTFEVDGEPLIGYARGRCSKAEIRRLDSFAASIGVTMFPCVQTLGHLEQILRYQRYASLRDTKRVVDPALSASREFVEKLIVEASEPYSTNLIHVGMDEPWGLGRGEAFVEDTPINPLETYAGHVAHVADVCAGLGLEPMMWGDVILGRSGGRAMSEDERKSLPGNMEMVYWNYFSEGGEDYIRDFETFREMGREPVFAPGLHTWNRFFPDVRLLERTSTLGTAVALDEKIRKILVTAWGDDGAECLFENLKPLVARSAALFRSEPPDADDWEKRSDAISGAGSADAAIAARSIESAAVLRSKNGGGAFSAKALFYDDPLIGSVARSLDAPKDVSAYFAEKASDIALSAGKTNGCRKKLSDLAALSAEILSAKARLSPSAAAAYAAKDPTTLEAAAGDATVLAGRVRAFRGLYSELWLEERKPFGLEVVEGRLAVLEARLETFANRITAYLAGKLSAIEEFEETPPSEIAPEDLKFHSQIVTRCHSIW